MYFYVDTWDNFVIEYSFHEKDFSLWEQILKIHRENVDKATLYNNFDEKLENIENTCKYYILRLKSEDPNLYRNISLIMYVKYENGYDTSKEMLKKNTWNL